MPEKMQTLVKLCPHLHHALEVIINNLIILTLLFIPAMFFFAWLKEYQTATTTTESHDPSPPKTLQPILDALTTIQRALESILSGLEELLCWVIRSLEGAQSRLRTAVGVRQLDN